MGERIETRRSFLKKLACGGVTLATGHRLLGEDSKQARPNFVLIMGDDISVDDFGCYGHPHIRTPNVDALAAGGIRFTNAYLTASQCSPTRCSIITGRYPHNTGAPELHMPLPEGQPLFPLKLKQAGYYTVAAGKWHMGSYPKAAFTLRLSGKGPGKEEDWVSCLRERPLDKPFFMWFASTDAHRRWNPDEHAKPHKPQDAVIPPYMADRPGTRKDLASYYDEVQRLDLRRIGRAGIEKAGRAGQHSCYIHGGQRTTFPALQDVALRQRRQNALGCALAEGNRKIRCRFSFAR
jgi:arylsulfatase